MTERSGPIGAALRAQAEREQRAAEQPVRHTVDTITSDALDALYELLDAAQQTELARQLATADKAFVSAHLRATRNGAAVARVRALHRPAHYGGQIICAECSAYDGHSSTDNSPVNHPCATVAALDEPKGPRT